jgi:sporulation protein YlmC with PRC-barrel domain
MQTIARNTLLSSAAALMLMAGTAYGQTTLTEEPVLPGATEETVGAGETVLPGTVAEGEQAGAAALTLPPERGQLREGVGELRTQDLEDMNVYSVGGEEVGEVEGLVRHNGDPHLVVSFGTGWFNWGGGDRVAIPVEHFERAQDGLIVQLTDAQAAALQEYVSQIDTEQMTEYETVGDAYALPAAE